MAIFNDTATNFLLGRQLLLSTHSLLRWSDDEEFLSFGKGSKIY